MAGWNEQHLGRSQNAFDVFGLMEARKAADVDIFDIDTTGIVQEGAGVMRINQVVGHATVVETDVLRADDLGQKIIFGVIM